MSEMRADTSTIGEKVGRRDDPALINDPAEAIKARVLITGVAVGFAGEIDVGQLGTGLRI